MTLAPTYQPPKHDLIVEPFAGSAQYAVYWLAQRPTLRAVLYDTDEMVIRSWQRMLDATPDEIAGWSIKVGDPVVDYVDMANGGGMNRIANDRIVRRFYESRKRWASFRAAIGDRVSVVHGDYTETPNVEATWFVDPPYQQQGKPYRDNALDLDYRELALWVKTRRGQTIVCEASPAGWLPFRSLGAPGRVLTGAFVSQELVWESDPDPTLFD